MEFEFGLNGLFGIFLRKIVLMDFKNKYSINSLKSLENNPADVTGPSSEFIFESLSDDCYHNKNVLIGYIPTPVWFGIYPKGI